MGGVRLDEARAQLAHVDVVVDDHVGARAMRREPGCDFLPSARAGRAGGGGVDDAAREPVRL